MSSNNLEFRFNALESEFVELKKLNGIPGPAGNDGAVGPRGPAGSIEAAVANAERAARKIIADAEARLDEKVKQVRTEFCDRAKSLIEEVRRVEKGQAAINARIEGIIERTVEARILILLQEYGLLDEQMNPINVGQLEFHLKRLGLLSPAQGFNNVNS